MILSKWLQAELSIEFTGSGIPLQGDVRIVVYDHDDGSAGEHHQGRLTCCARQAVDAGKPGGPDTTVDSAKQAGDEVRVHP
jgi:hypothetical protein